MGFDGQTHRPASNERRSKSMKALYADGRPPGMGFKRLYETEEERKFSRSRQNKIRQLKCRYGITLEDYELMVTAQDGRCAICKRVPDPGKPLHVDHDHTTGLIRQLLCRRCNTCLGLIGDSVEVLESAIEYLSLHSGVSPESS